MPQFDSINISITDANGILIDSFTVCHFKSPNAGSFSDEENTGSNASDSLLVHRIRQYVKPA